MTGSPWERPPGWTPVTGEERLPFDVWFRIRVLRQAYLESRASWHLHRAEQFEAARPKPCDFNGAADTAELEERDRELAAIAQACRRRAALGDVSDSEFSEALEATVRGVAA